MKRLIFLPIFMLGCLVATAQKVVYELDLSTTIEFASYKNSYHINNQLKEEAVIFYNRRKKTEVFVYNTDVANPTRFTPTRLFDQGLNDYLGSSVTGNTYHLYFTDNSKRKLRVYALDVATQEVSKREVAYTPLSGTRFLTAAMHQNKLYVFGVKTGSSIIRITQLEEGKVTGQHEFDLTGVQFYNQKDAIANRRKLSALFRKFGFIAVNNTLPQKFSEVAQAAFKAYFDGDKLYITGDRKPDVTQVITIDLKEFAHQLHEVPYTDLNCGTTYKLNYGSYLHQGKLFQLKGCQEMIDLSVRQLNDGQLLQSFSATADEEITFKNSPMVQVGARWWTGVTKTVEKTKPILRKLSKNDAGIVIDTMSDTLVLTIGSYVYQESPPTQDFNTGMLVGGGSYSKEVTFKTLLNANTLAHVPGTMNAKSFEYRSHRNEVEATAMLMGAFRLNGKLYLTYYHEPEYDRLLTVRQFN